MWICRRIISRKGVVCLTYLIRSIATHVGDERREKGIASVTALLRGIRKDHGLSIVRIERPSASTGFRPSASTGLFALPASTGLFALPASTGQLVALRLHALITE